MSIYEDRGGERKRGKRERGRGKEQEKKVRGIKGERER
jgi:hypothetical protein